jgi:hypothetical protein
MAEKIIEQMIWAITYHHHHFAVTVTVIVTTVGEWKLYAFSNSARNGDVWFHNLAIFLFFYFFSSSSLFLLLLLLLLLGSRKVGRAVPGSPCYRNVTLAALRGFQSLSRGVRCEMQFSSPTNICAW